MTTNIGDFDIAAVNAIIIKGRESARTISIESDAMEPALSRGEVALLDNCRLPPTPDRMVVIYNYEGDEIKAIACRLVSFDDDEWLVETLNPQVEQFKLARSEWTNCHKIVRVHLA